jgi:large conductance mechanosensitive channel
MFNEFKKFAMRGNVVDLAVGVIIGAAFGKIVDSLVKDVVMPPIGLVMGRVDFTNLFVVLRDGNPPGPYTTVELAQKAGAVTLNYGIFINTMISFLIVTWAVFVLVKIMNRMHREQVAEPAAAPEPAENVLLLREIRDELRNRGR